MKPTELDFRKLPIRHALVLKQTLSAAIATADSLPVMFPIDECGSGVPTPGQVTYAREILADVLNNWECKLHHIPYVTDCLGYMLEEFTMFNDDPDVDHMPGHEYLQRMFGIDFTPYFEQTLRDCLRQLRDDTETVDDYEAYLTDIKHFVESTVTEMLDELAVDGADNGRYEIKLSFHGRDFTLQPCAAEYNGLVDYLDFIISEQ